MDDYASGVLGGVAKVVTGAPFDLVKSRVQSGMYATPLRALSGTVKHEGVRALWKGIGPPCASVGLVSGLLFYVNGAVRRCLQPNPDVQLTYLQMHIAGSVGGAVVGCLVTPFETMKLNRQLRIGKGGVEEIVASVTLREAYQMRGIAGLYSGFGPTLAREVVTFGIFFPVNDFFLNTFKKRRDSHSSKINNTNDRTTTSPSSKASIPVRVICAGTAGIVCWFPAYPVDNVKTAVQRSAFQTDPAQRLSSASATRLLYAEGGVLRFYRGITPCLIRAFPAYAAQYLTFEQCSSYLRQRRHAAE